MDANILLSKIVASPTETTWSQAYSTLNLYVVLSVKAPGGGEEKIVTVGKELLERIQREYFSESEKSLENIKKSIEQAISDVPDLNNVSIALATITTPDIAYIITVSGAKVILKRHGRVGTVAEGTVGEVNAFSGKIQPDDIIILETEDFSQKIPVSQLSKLLDNLEVTEIAESLAPIVHGEAKGTETAIVLQYKKIHKEEVAETEEKIVDEIASDEILEREDEIERKPGESFLSKIKIPNVSIPNSFLAMGKKKAVIIGIVLLAILFLGSIVFEKGRQEQAKREQVLSEILTPAQKKYDEANALIALNKGLALDEFNDLKKNLDDSQSKLTKGTAEQKKLEEFIGKVESKIGELGAGSTLANQKLLYDKGADFVEFKGKTFAVVKKDSGDINLLSSDGTSTKTLQTKNGNVAAVAGNDNSIYVFGDLGITKTDKQTGKTSTIIKGISNTVSIDIFGSNLYGLTTKNKTVDKYAGESAPTSAYFKESITLTNPVSMAIDGSVWIIDSGKIRKFTKGAEDTFTISGLTKDLSGNSQIFTSTDYSNVYVLDRDTTRIVLIGKDGTVKNQYVSKDLSNASSFAVDESGKKIYVVISTKLYSFDL